MKDEKITGETDGRINRKSKENERRISSWNQWNSTNTLSVEGEGEGEGETQTHYEQSSDLGELNELLSVERESE